MIGRRRSQRRRTRPSTSRATLLAILAVTGLAGSGCRDPYAEVRARLDPADLARFDRGARVAAPCAACHDFAGTARKIGPHLSNLAGRRAGGVDGFAYSDALAGADFVWDARSLDAFLADPQRVAPGNRMMSPAVLDPAARSDLSFFLLMASSSSASDLR